MKMLFLKEAAYANKRVPETFDARGLNSLLARLRKNNFFQIAILVLIVDLKFCATWEELSHNKRKSCSWKAITYSLNSRVGVRV